MINIVLILLEGMVQIAIFLNINIINLCAGFP